MIIRNKQYEGFRMDSKKKFIEKINPLVRNQYPEKTWQENDEQLNELLELIIDRALSYNILIENDVFKFVLLNYRLGDKFEKQQEYKDVLNILVHKTLVGTLKIKKIEDIIFKLEE